MTAPFRILTITTSAARMSDGAPTGVWLEELTTPYYAFRDAGADVTADQLFMVFNTLILNSMTWTFGPYGSGASSGASVSVYLA
ncbi:hypothetical protein J8J40_29655, partial [Mycobacterium tuberculosis]|nr:hypothetical protein [Mycobacterium tuberculosis]